MSKLIFISSGHGGRDCGAVSKDGKLKEAELALRLRDAVASNLKSKGCDVVTDGGTGENQSLPEALKKFHLKPVVAVEFHFNAGPVNKATGVEALSLPAYKPLAQALAQATSNETGLFARGDRGWKPDTAGQHHRLAFCRAGGVILEICFISNNQDLQTYLANQFRVARALAGVLERFAGMA